MALEQVIYDKNRRERVYTLLDRLEIQYGVIDHPPMFTQADSEHNGFQIDAIIFKNLFLRNKDKSRFYLYALPLAKRADLDAVAKALGETRLSFGGEDALQDKLHIQHGAVSLLNAVDAGKTSVVFMIDSSAFEYDRIGIHPNDNTAIVTLKPQDIEKILASCGVKYRFLALDSGEPVIVRAQEKDAAEILRLQYAAYQSEAIFYNDFTIQPLTQTLEQTSVEIHNYIILNAVLENRIIGSVRAYENNETAYVGKLMVLPGYQNRGIGKMLLQSIENEFHIKRYELYTGVKSEKNLTLYEKCGYSRFKTKEVAPGLMMVYLEKQAAGSSVYG